MGQAQVSMDQFLRLSRRLDKFAQRFNDEVVLKVFPVGALFLTMTEMNPAAYLGGQWERYAEGCCLVGVDPNDNDFSKAGQKVGTKTVALSEANNGAHTHIQGAHTHLQNSHNHTQSPHNHTQNAHNHTQNAHYHSFSNGNIAGSNNAISGGGSGSDGYWAFNGSMVTNRTADTVGTNNAETAINNESTAVNNAATATNQYTTAVNQSSGSGEPHNNIQPSVLVYIWMRVA